MLRLDHCIEKQASNRARSRNGKTLNDLGEVSFPGQTVFTTSQSLKQCISYLVHTACHSLLIDHKAFSPYISLTFPSILVPEATHSSCISQLSSSAPFSVTSKLVSDVQISCLKRQIRKGWSFWCCPRWLLQVGDNDFYGLHTKAKQSTLFCLCSSHPGALTASQSSSSFFSHYFSVL
jgi:hypothetical protein